MIIFDFSMELIYTICEVNSLSNNFSNDEKFYFENFADSGKYSESLFEPIIIDDSINVSLADINNLNIIINDDECSDSYIEAICQQLDVLGIVYAFSKQEDNINSENSTIITLDQQYVAGPKVSIIGSYENNRGDNSDALALAMETSFRANGIASSGVFCGRRGYRQSSTDTITTRIPTPTEDTIPTDFDTSFVTISFGTDIPSAESVANVIVGGLGRYLAYINSRGHADLLYRAGANDSIENLAEHFGSSSFEVSNLNGISDAIPCDESIINPIEYDSPIFDKNIPVKVREFENNMSLK